MLDASANFLMENVNLEHRNVNLNDIIRLCVLNKSCSPRCYLAKGFDFNKNDLYNSKYYNFSE